MAVPGLAVGAAVLLLRVAVVAPYPSGKVTESCHDMVPRHGHTPHPDPVHRVAVSQTTFAPGDRLEVTLSGPEFKGFLLEARNAEDLDGPPVGSFTLIDSEVSQLLTCEDRQGSAVSHTNPHKKTEIQVHWTAPQRAPNHVQFLATVVEKYKTYWVKIPSAVISQANAPPFSTPEATAAPLSTSPPVSRLTKPFSASGCGNKKFCVRSPSACDPEKDHACVFLSFTRNGQSVVAELSGPSKGYVSFAFSHDRWMFLVTDNNEKAAILMDGFCSDTVLGNLWPVSFTTASTFPGVQGRLGGDLDFSRLCASQGDDDAYLCVREGQAVRIQPSHLTGRSHPVLDSSDALEDMAWRLEDGLIQCSFRRNVTLPGAKNRFALNTSYYIFLASGAVEEGRIYRHSQQPLITYDRYDVTGLPEDLGGSQAPLLLKAHGALMLVAWVAAVSIGVIVARFFKPVLSQPLFGEAVWFQVHRTLMLTTCVLTGIAFVLPFVYRGGWSRRAGCHPYLGCAVMTMAALQPLLAGFRPPLHDPRRYLFNWTHWGLGTAARIIAVAAMFLGMDLPGLSLPGPWKTYTMLGFVAWHVGAEVILEIHTYRLSRKVEILDDTRIQIIEPFTIADAEGHAFKKAVLAVYVCGNVTFLLIFLAAIYRL